MRHFRGDGWQKIEFLDRSKMLLPGHAATPVKFHDRVDAANFLRRLGAATGAMTGLRELLGETSDSGALALSTDGEVIDRLAAQLYARALEVVITARPKVSPPQARQEDEPPPKAKQQEEKADQDVEFVITDHLGDALPDLEWVLVYPDGKTKKTGKLGEDGKVSQTSVPPGSYQLLFKIVSAARWGDSRVQVDKEVKLLATAAGFDPGAPGKFEIFESSAVDKKPLARVDGKVNASRVLEGAWTPTKDAVKDLTTSTLVFQARMAASNAVSSPAEIVIKHSFELEDDKGPLADTTVVARFSDGHEATATSKGGKLDILVPLGQKLAWIDLPDHTGGHLTVEAEGDEAREYLLWESSDESPPPADDSDGDESDESDAEDESDEDEDGEADEDDEDDGADEGEDANA
ncbi:MAG: hypothetical protein ABJE95_21670 [Byssovorax sp.]